MKLGCLAKGMMIGYGINSFLDKIFPKVCIQDKEQIILDRHREDFLKYYWNDLIQGQAP